MKRHTCKKACVAEVASLAYIHSQHAEVELRLRIHAGASSSLSQLYNQLMTKLSPTIFSLLLTVVMSLSPKLEPMSKFSIVVSLPG